MLTARANFFNNHPYFSGLPNPSPGLRISGFPEKWVCCCGSDMPQDIKKGECGYNSGPESVCCALA